MSQMHHGHILGIPDTQSEPDMRHMAIDRVGVRGVRHPMQIQVMGQTCTTIATWELDVALPAEQKGTHMSRFVAWLDAHPEVFTRQSLAAASLEMLQRLHAQTGRLEVAFTFFIRKRAPVSGIESLLDYQGRWIVEASVKDDPSIWAEVLVPVKSLCPCSKEISEYGAHNQRSHVRIRAQLLDDLPWEALVRHAELNASSEIWPMLKRADEKWVTERAYENPKFVEDLARDVALSLKGDERIGRFEVDVENFESIHNHSAFARIVG